MTVDNVLRLADLRLLAAKAAGRDRAVIECDANERLLQAQPAPSMPVLAW